MSDLFDGEVETIYVPRAATVPPGAVTGPEFAALTDRVTTLEDLPAAADTTTDLTDWSATAPAEGQFAIYTGGKWTPTTRPPITITSAITAVIDGGGAVITTGPKLDIRVPAACTLIANAMALADQSGSISIDVWKAGYASYPPTAADSICGGSPLVISGDAKGVNTVAAWSTSLAADDILRLNVDSAATVTRVMVSLRIRMAV